MLQTLGKVIQLSNLRAFNRTGMALEGSIAGFIEFMAKTCLIGLLLKVKALAMVFIALCFGP